MSKEEKLYAIGIKDGAVIHVSSYNKTLQELKEKVDEHNKNTNDLKYIIAEDEILIQVCSFKVSEKESYRDSVKDFKERISNCEYELSELSREIRMLED